MAGTNSTAVGRSGAREWTIRVVMVFVSLVVSLLLAEAISRVAFPISERREQLTLDGKPVDDFMKPGSVYRQITNEYDAVTTITDKGHRVPAVDGNPDVIFIGDSITFGNGLSDDQTFVSIYCKARNISCANLGVAGDGTLAEVERLEKYLADWNWKPREVRLFFAGMSKSFSAGNDFVDNYNREMYERRKRAGGKVPDKPPAGGVAERIIGKQVFLLRHSNLIRMAKFYAGPMLKSLVVADPGEERFSIALEATSAALQRLDALSRQAGFEYRIFLVVPVQDIIRGSAADTLATLNSVSPKPVIPTAPLFEDAPAHYYYAFDGHLNPLGARRVAEFMATLD